MKRHHRKPSKIKSPSGELFFKPKVQKKLTMGEANDVYEIEADKMADAVVNKTDKSTGLQKKSSGEEEIQQKPLASAVTPWVQKKSKGEEEPVQQTSEEEESVQQMEEEEPVQRQEGEMTEDDRAAIQEMQEEGEIPVQHQLEEEPVQQMAEEEEPVQQMEEEESVQSKEEEESVQPKEEEEPVQAKTNQTTKSPNIEGKLKEKSGRGSAMDADTLNEMENSFGADFSAVNIHTGSEAEHMSENMGAQAFTHGHDIFFNKGKYDPKSKKGKHLLAHELAHTLQQKGVRQKKVQRKPSFKVKGPVQRIDMFDPATAPDGNSAVIGETKMYVNGHDLSKYLEENGPEATANLLFPLPEFKKVGGECHIVNKDLKVDVVSEYSILVPGPWVKSLSKEEIKGLLGGALKDRLHQIQDGGATVNIEGDPSDAKLMKDDIKAELQHVASDRCLFASLLQKYQQDVDALPNQIPTDYGGFGSCESKLEQLLGRVDRYNSFISEAHADKRFYDTGGKRPHDLVPEIEVSDDGTLVNIKLKFKDLGMERPCDL